MTRLSALWRSFRNRSHINEEMAGEMRFHIESRAADLERSGLAPTEALRRARIEFGGLHKYSQEGRAARGLALADQVAIDLRVAVRSVKRAPLFAAVAVTTIACGIAANAVIFSLVNSVLLRPLAYTNPDRIYTARSFEAANAHLVPDLPVNPRHFDEWRKACSACEQMALFVPSPFNFGGAGQPRRLDGIQVSPAMFPLLGTRMQLGRAFAETEGLPGANRVIVIADALWRTEFGSDPRVIGRTVTWNQSPVEIVGVLPPDFRFPTAETAGAFIKMPDRIEAIRPLAIDPAKFRPTGNYSFGALVKLKDGTGVPQAASQMSRALEPLTGQNPKERVQALLTPLRHRMTQDVRAPLWLLMGAALAVLGIVCVNLGNLMMARAAARYRDWTIRTAIGASRADLFRHALVESLALSFCGGLLGAALTAAAIPPLLQMDPATLPRLDELHLDWRVALFTFLLVAFTGLLASIAPAWRMLRASPRDALGAGSARVTETRAERRARNALLSFEAALSVVLAAAAALLIASFVKVLAADRGFDTQRVLTFQLSLPEGRYKMDRRDQFHRDVLAALEAIPGAAAVGFTTHLPLQGETWVMQIRRKGEARHYSESPQANYRFVSAGFFAAMGIPIRRGRALAETDRAHDAAVLSESAARKAFPNEDPIGRFIEWNEEKQQRFLEVVGIVADVKTNGLEHEPPPIVYVPYWLTAPAGGSYAVRAHAGDETALIASARAAVATVDREMPIHRVRSMTEIVGAAAASRRLITAIATGFASAGVLLACLGIFGVVSYSVSRRTGEIGVRMALGATRASVVALVLNESMRPVVLGLFVGLLAALTSGRVLASQLYGVTARDPFVLGAVAAAIWVAATLASWWPALRASRIEPVRALRFE